jgi:glycosyltransferase involved in cell wall biosynthesis
VKINWFSPLPPARSDIARVTRGLLPLLAEQAEIVIWSSDPEWSREIEEFGEVHYYNPNKLPWRDINQADVTVYLIGNDPQYHGAIWAVARQHPGIVVLHDLKLQDFFLVLAEQRRFINESDYLRMTEFHYGSAGRKLAESYLRRAISLAELADQCSLVEFVTDNALAVVAHSEAGCDKLADGASLPVAYLPLCVCDPMPRIDLDRRPAGDMSEPYRIIIFGFLGRNRRVDAFLNTFADFPQRSRFRLDVYGTSQTEEITQHLICELGLSESVKVHGFVPEDTLHAALRQSDLAINLRYPTMGEASGSQLVIWQYGLPSLVTRIGWYATLPEDTVSFVRFDHERTDIHAHLNSFLAEPERYREIGRNGRRYVEQHHTREGYVTSLLELANNVSNNRAIWSTRNLSSRVGVAMSGWCDETTVDELSGRVAQEIQILSGKSGQHME